jgi:hypothetical protein
MPLVGTGGGGGNFGADRVLRFGGIAGSFAACGGETTFLAFPLEPPLGLVVFGAGVAAFGVFDFATGRRVTPLDPDSPGAAWRRRHGQAR